ncbi:40S ribosomal protein [Hortaea werneckii]|nr:40S ribosomal protein [Hortaea werneckii]KAI6976485.1 40S ribosomal protein [Hortaea werneckii]KAI7056119.1 40S ribosomal protein [Hortaea werneckii]KAI7252621.1 40S ribosomal protein [Hortaea werneckii]KAI7421486.1 40S ribosomal protein [Hortaea werneckii]
MADQEYNPEEAAELKRKRAFRKFSYRGIDLDELLDLSSEQLRDVVHARARRRFNRGLKRKPMGLIKKLRKAKQEAPPNEKPAVVKTHLRDMIVVPEMIGSVVGVYSGKEFNTVEIKPEMVGHYLAEFSISYHPVRHGRPGIGATHSSLLGHEGAGKVVKIGSDVNPNLFSLGDRVAIHLIPGCNKSDCLECSRGLHVLRKADESGNYGLGRDGMFAEYVACQARAAVKVPDSVEIPAAAVAPDAVLTAYQAVKYTGAVQPDHTIVIFGLGGVGLNGVQTALHLGVKRILVVDKRQHSLDEAVALGIPKENCFCTGEGSNVKKIEEFVAENNIQVDVAVDFVGHADTILAAQMLVRPAGLIVQVGLLAQHAPLIPGYLVMHAKTIKGNYNGSLESFAEVMELMGQGVLKPKLETGSIEDLPKVLKDLDDGKVRTRMVLLPDWKE